MEKSLTVRNITCKDRDDFDVDIGYRGNSYYIEEFYENNSKNIHNNDYIKQFAKDYWDNDDCKYTITELARILGNLEPDDGEADDILDAIGIFSRIFKEFKFPFYVEYN